jgi:uncharacterized membrane protein
MKLLDSFSNLLVTFGIACILAAIIVPLIMQYGAPRQSEHQNLIRVPVFPPGEPPSSPLKQGALWNFVFAWFAILLIVPYFGSCCEHLLPSTWRP